MMKEKLKAIKEFAEENFCREDGRQFYVDDEEFALVNPWIDHSGRFELTDEEAVREWGLDEVLEFCIGALGIIERREYGF